jgi:hypothetical protein
MLIPMSLVMESCAVADFVASAWLLAVTWTSDGEGRSPGAVYTPAAVIVPLDVLPPATPFTLQVTLVSVVFVTLAVNVCELPSSIEPLVGVTVTLIDVGGGGGGGATDSGLPPPQPRSDAHWSRSWKTRRARIVWWAVVGMRPPVSVLIWREETACRSECRRRASERSE